MNNEQLARMACWIAKEWVKGPWPAGEHLITTSAQWSYQYALHSLRAPFPAGEAAIATDATYSYLYAYVVLEGPFPLGEAAIATDTWFMDRYSRKFYPKTTDK